MSMVPHIKVAYADLLRLVHSPEQPWHCEPGLRVVAYFFTEHAMYSLIKSVQ